MAKTEPIRDKEQLKALADYFLKKGQLRNYVLMIMAVYTVLRISDLLQFKWNDVYNYESRSFRKHLTMMEYKTGKRRSIALNS